MLEFLSLLLASPQHTDTHKLTHTHKPQRTKGNSVLKYQEIERERERGRELV